MQNSHNGASNHAAADMQLQDMLSLDDTSMADFDLPSDFDLVNFNDPIATPGNNDPTSVHPFQQQSHPANLGVQSSVDDPDDNAPHHQNNTTDEEDDDDAQMTGVGAGPLPTGFGVSLPPNTGSTLTEFTKRRNWSQRVVEEIKDFLHILTPDGRLMYVSPSTQTLTGYDPQDLVGKIMSNFVHPDDSGMFMREFHESIASGHPLRFFYRLRKPDQTYAIFEVHGHPHFSSDVTAGYGGNNSHGVSFCRGFFMMSRPYPSKNAALLDSFLEHKIENERLQKRISDLKREEQDDLQEQYMAASGPSSATGIDQKSAPGGLTPSAAKLRRPSLSADSSGMIGSGTNSDYNAMPPPAKPTISNWALTQRNLDEALAASRPDSINDKMARYEGSNHLEGIEMMTGLRYRDGERSKGISTGAMSPTLVRGDQGIEFPADRDGRRASIDRNRSYADSPSRAFGAGDSERKKKIKVADEYVCTDCGTLDSPEWRRGPNGPKTLCNACGLRWAKQEKKRVGTAPPASKPGANNGNNGPTSAESARQSISGNASTSPTTASHTPKATLSGTSPNHAGLPALGNMQHSNNATMPIFQGNNGANTGPLNVNISAAQAVQGMAPGMSGSPMSGLSPMGLPGGGNMMSSMAGNHMSNSGQGSMQGVRFQNQMGTAYPPQQQHMRNDGS